TSPLRHPSTRMPFCFRDQPWHPRCSSTDHSPETHPKPCPTKRRSWWTPKVCTARDGISSTLLTLNAETVWRRHEESDRSTEYAQRFVVTTGLDRLADRGVRRGPVSYGVGADCTGTGCGGRFRGAGRRHGDEHRADD